MEASCLVPGIRPPDAIDHEEYYCLQPKGAEQRISGAVEVCIAIIKREENGAGRDAAIEEGRES